MYGLCAARDKVSKVVIDETIKRSALGGLAATAQLPLRPCPTLEVDDPWAVAVQRAKGGRSGAEALLDQQGHGAGYIRGLRRGRAS